MTRGRKPLPENKRKKYINIRLDRDVIEYFKKDGKGYTTRINTELRKASGLDKIKSPSDNL